MPEIFKKVKKDVIQVYGWRKGRRAGLSLGLVEMGMFRGGFIGGMHFPPGTDIVMNKTPLQILLKEQPNEIILAYTYHILLHEYIHALGTWDEETCKKMTLEVTKEIFKNPKHPAMILATNGIGSYFPNLHLIYAPPGLERGGLKIEYINGFDEDSYSYYS